MSWLRKTEKLTGSETATTSEVLACFHGERALLFRFALLITADEAAAERCLIEARETTIKGHGPFRDWLTEWAKVATVTNAIQHCITAIRGCEALYDNQQCTHIGHLTHAEDSNREPQLAAILETDPEIVIDALDPLSRAVLVLKVAMRCSVKECALRLNVPRAAVTAAYCRAMTWVSDQTLVAFN